MEIIEEIIKESVEKQNSLYNKKEDLKIISYLKDQKATARINAQHFVQFPQIEAIYLGDFYLEKIDVLNNLPYLESLTCRVEGTQLPIINPKQLKSLNLSDSYFIESLHNLERYEVLYELLLNNNYISDIFVLTAKQSIWTLFLEKNLLKNIEQITKFPNIFNLNISKNFIVDLMPLESLPHLNYLIASDNRIKAIPLMKKLESMELDNNPLHDIMQLNYMENLSEVSLKSCNLRSLKNVQNKSVKTLKISNNLLREGMDFLNFPNLRLLNASNNKISNIQFLREMKHVHEVNLNGNMVSSIANIYISDKLKNITLEKQIVYSKIKEDANEEYYVIDNIIFDDKGKHIIPINISSQGVYNYKEHTITWDKKILLEHDPYDLVVVFKFSKEINGVEVRFSGCLFPEVETRF